MTTALIIVLAVYAAALTYLRATASKTKTTADDKALEVLEKGKTVADILQAKVDAAKK